MEYQLTASTAAGGRLVSLAEHLGTEFAAAAALHDQEASYPVEHIDILRGTGYLNAPFPVEHGGLGVVSTHDLIIAASRLSRGDPAVTIGASMHVIGALAIARNWRNAVHRGDHAAAETVATQMEHIVRTEMVIAVTVSEPKQDLLRPSTRATRAEGGWVIDGTKIFATMSPAATHLSAGVAYTDHTGRERFGVALIPRNADGVIYHDDWDALGMRASGSGSVTYSDVMLPERALRDAGYPVGVLSTGFLERYLGSGAFHAAASVGIAESASILAIEAVRNRRAGEWSCNAALQSAAADNAIDVAAMRSMLGHAGTVVDSYFESYSPGSATIEQAVAAFAEVQACKSFITDAARRIVDRSMQMAGGGAYMNRNPLSRHYRDVLAGAFMHPLSTVAAQNFIGRAALGLEPRF